MKYGALKPAAPVIENHSRYAVAVSLLASLPSPGDLIELRFMRFLDPDLVEKIHRAHVARKASGRPLEEFLPSERGFYP